MALADNIQLDIVKGLIPREFRSADLKTRRATPGRFYVGATDYAENALNTIPRNLSIRRDGTEPGNYVQKGQRPKFYWLSVGLFCLIDDQACDCDMPPSVAGLDCSEGDDESLFTGPEPRPAIDLYPAELPDLPNQSDPVAIIVDTLAQRPFQFYSRRARTWHPPTVAIGWPQRLNAYCWPGLGDGWDASKRRIDGFLSRGRKLAREWQVDDPRFQNELRALFGDVCAWGGVKLPKLSSAAMARAVGTALGKVDAGHLPTRAESPLNSAWTKLYAVLRPDDFLIFDSRVATALTSILDPNLPALRLTPAWSPYRSLGTAPGRGGTRPRQMQHRWPIGYQNWESQLAANALGRAIRDELNRRVGAAFTKDDGTAWTLREVEAVLFMEGY